MREEVLQEVDEGLGERDSEGEGLTLREMVGEGETEEEGVPELRPDTLKVAEPLREAVVQALCVRVPRAEAVRLRVMEGLPEALEERPGERVPVAGAEGDLPVLPLPVREVDGEVV